MYLAGLLVLLLAAGVWDQKPPAEWSVEEVQGMLESSPWSRLLRESASQELRAHLASALPMREAEGRERTFQRRTGAADASLEEYLAMLEEGKYIVLAVHLSDREGFSDSIMVDRMKRDSQMRAGKAALRLVTYFPPSSSDPYLRLVFPRVEQPGKTLEFTIVVPGAADPYRRLIFYTKEMIYRGKLEY